MALADLDKRGASEFLTVDIPITDGDARLTAEEIAPYLGRYGKCTPVPRNNSVRRVSSAS